MQIQALRSVYHSSSLRFSGTKPKLDVPYNQKDMEILAEWAAQSQHVNNQDFLAQIKAIVDRCDDPLKLIYNNQLQQRLEWLPKYLKAQMHPNYKLALWKNRWHLFLTAAFSWKSTNADQKQMGELYACDSEYSASVYRDLVNHLAQDDQFTLPSRKALKEKDLLKSLPPWTRQLIPKR